MFTATVSRTRALTHDVREMELTLADPAAMTFVPGQWVSFEIEREGSRLPATRAYSIASSAHRTNAIELVLNRVADGPGSGYLFGLQEGETTAFRGPLGTFVLRDSPRDLLFVATGTGIAPFRSMLWSLAEASSSRAVTLLWGLRSEQDLYLPGRTHQSPRAAARVLVHHDVIAANGHVAWHRRTRHRNRRSAGRRCCEPRSVPLWQRRDDPGRPGRSSAERALSDSRRTVYDIRKA